MLALSLASASTVSLLLNLEGVFTALLAWFVFQENFDRRVMLGMLLIVCGGLVLSWPSAGISTSLPALAVAGACLCWAVDNNLTRKISAVDPFVLAAIKGICAGGVNTALAVASGAKFPAMVGLVSAMSLGFFSYGLGLVLFIVALRYLGTARTGAYYGTAPFIGAIASAILLSTPLTTTIMAAGMLMALGAWLHLSERHGHGHSHEELEHDHRHVHDEHHQHEHGADDPTTEPHAHPHRHTPIKHTHAHWPDLHHRHTH